jgi:periplasmic protein TonB
VPAPSPVSAAPTAAPPSITPDTSSDTGADIGPGPTAAAVADPANALQELGIVETPPTVPVVPQAPIRLGNLVPPRKTFNVDPLYPSLARSARVEGVVVLEAVIDRLGRVESVRVLRSIPLLDPAALDAVRQWRFTPTLLNGTPVSIVMVVTVNFSLSAR